jgi:serine-type D-Ala-D-Ala carboxypeptidase (penicillin-binding protein 5/6)
MRCFAFVVCLFVAFAAPALAAPFQSKAPYALLVDISDGKTLYDKRGDASMSPASTTKILTAEVVFTRLAAGQLTLEDTFPISAHAATEGDAESGGSSMFLQAGAKVKLDDLLQGLLVESGNDAAIAIAEGIAGSEKGFAALMNARARAIGMSHSSFTNPWGRAGNRVTPRDMVRLAAHVIRSTTNISVRANSPGTASARRTAIRCSPTAPTGSRRGIWRRAVLGWWAQPCTAATGWSW